MQLGRPGAPLSLLRLAGLCAGIPGSHKANVGLPDNYLNLDKNIDENVRPIGCRAGDCIIFTEALSKAHAMAPWLNQFAARVFTRVRWSFAA